MRDRVVDWLLEPGEPSVRYYAFADLLGKAARSPDVREARAAIPGSPRVAALFSGQRADGGFGVPAYSKWSGSHWRLVSLVELGLPAGEPRALKAFEDDMRWMWSAEHARHNAHVGGRARVHGSIEGNSLAVACRLGLGRGADAARLAEVLLSSQWPDGGWNCDRHPRARHSSFHESLAPMWGLDEFWIATGSAGARRAARAAAEMFLRHHLFLSERTGRVISAEWTQAHYPPYWHYDMLQALLVLARIGPLRDPRLRDALDRLEERKRPDGTWGAGRPYWRSPSGPGTGPREVVDWGRNGPNRFVTLNALRVLKAAGRWR